MVTKPSIYFLNPPYENLALEEEVLAGSIFRLIPVLVRSGEEVVQRASEAVAIITRDVPITGEIASCLKDCKVITRLGVGYDIVDVAGCRSAGIGVGCVPYH